MNQSKPRPFLETVARGYAARYRDLSQFYFIFPGRRSGTFFIRELQKALGSRTMIAPATFTVTDLINSLNDAIPDSRIDLLFLLYRCYLEVTDDMKIPEDERMSFDHFRSLGEMILSDFNDVDTHLADADKIFANLRDYNEISTDFLTDEQRRIMEDYFGIAAPFSTPDSFWKKFEGKDPDSHGGLRNRFLFLWQILAPLYHKFYEKLEKEGLTYPGMAARRALQFLEDNGPEKIPAKKLVFIGFNVLTSVEYRIFSCLRDMRTVIDGTEQPFADFVWDFTGIPLKDTSNSAGKFVVRGMKSFPKPEWLDLSPSQASGIPEKIKVISSPSATIQGRLTGMALQELNRSVSAEQFDSTRVAIVLPDESLLSSVINSIPEDFTSINLTMGLPIRHTPVASFVYLLRMLQSHARKSSSASATPVFYFEDIRALLSHPFTAAMLGEQSVFELKNMLQKVRRAYIGSSVLTHRCPPCGDIFRFIPPKASPAEVTEYIDSLLRKVHENIAERIQENRAKKIDKEDKEEIDETEGGKNETTRPDNIALVTIDAYRRALTRLLEACTMRGVTPDVSNIFILTERLIAGERVLFEGEPLKGLQVMGLLETRSLDFEHIIIPSMNERIFPRRIHQRTFIPAALRNAFGLPTVHSQESIMAYYFYRLICRASSVTMLYDARTGETRSGDPSRFILQLKHLYAKGKDRMTTYSATFSLCPDSFPEVSVAKSPEIMEKLQEYYTSSKTRRDMAEGKRVRALSNNSLSTYLSCPLRFYFQYVAKISPEEEPSEFISAVALGDIVHNTMERLYLPDRYDREVFLNPPHRLTEQFFKNLLVKGSHTIDRAVEYSIHTDWLGHSSKNGKFDDLTGEPALQCGFIEDMIRGIVKLDNRFSTLDLLGCEIKAIVPFPIGDGREVTFEMHIDRMDYVEGGKLPAVKKGQPPVPAQRFRIVDYKTGDVRKSLVAETIDDLLSCAHGTKYFYQLMLYATLCRHDPQLKNIPDFQPVIYDVQASGMEYPELGKETVYSVHQKLPESEAEAASEAAGMTWGSPSLIEVFEQGVRRSVEELLDPDIPFTQTSDIGNCTYCPFAAICHRAVPKT